jgi:hypothetical protein
MITSQSGPVVLVVADDLQRREQLAALRRLRPTIAIAHPRGPLARQLFMDLLACDDAIDPLPWLISARAQTVALLALALALDFATSCAASRSNERRALAAASDAAWSAAMREADARSRALFGRLLTASDAWIAPDRLVDRIADARDADAVRRLLSQMRARSALPVETTPQRSLVEPTIAVLLADLLRLPDAVDPVAWLATARGEAVARLSLDAMLRQVMPTPQHLLAERGAEVRPPIRPRLRVRAGSLIARLERMEFYANCFRLHFRARIISADAAKMMFQSFTPDALTRWNGVTRVVDDAGYRYVVQIEDYEVMNQCWWWRQELTLVCWPALDAAARSLTLHQQPAALARYRIPRIGDQMVPLAMPELGALQVRIPLPH